MKTVAGSVCGLDEHFRYCGKPEPRDLGRIHGDLAVRYILGLPDDVPDDLEDGARLPEFRLVGRDDMWITFTRKGSNRELHLSMKDGETDVRVDEMQATYRLRMFVDHWGQETDLTSEVRLPPEARRQIREREKSIDEARRARLEEGPMHREFGARTHTLHAVLVSAAGLVVGGLLLLLLGNGNVPFISATAVIALSAAAGIWLFMKRYTLIVDREKGAILERDLGGESLLRKLDQVEFADVDGLEDESTPCELIVRTEEEGVATLGKPVWTATQADAIADTINDALGIDEGKRKFFAYRRHSRKATQP